MEQLGLTLAPAASRAAGEAAPAATIPASAREEASIAARFEAFHAANPDVYEELRALALAGARRGLRRLGIGSLFEVLRWNRNMATVGDDFRLNNNYRSRYARLLMEREPELAGIFELRELRTEDP